MLLFLVGVLRNGDWEYWYLVYNLGLAAIPLLLARFQLRLLGRYDWKDWRTFAMGSLWLLFLPNSFYIVTDFIHIADVVRVDVVQDVAMLMQFSVLGLLFGYISLYMLHGAYIRYLGARTAMGLAIGALFLSSLAIYLGRELRWNSWDVLLHPHTLLIDFLRLWANLDAMALTVTYFGMLATFYLLWWYGIELRQNARK